MASLAGTGEPATVVPRFEDRTCLLLGEHASFDPLRIERELDLALPIESAPDAILALGEKQETKDIANLPYISVRHLDTYRFRQQYRSELKQEAMGIMPSEPRSTASCLCSHLADERRSF